MVVFVALWSALACAQTPIGPIHRPLGAGREVRTFDFEPEDDTGGGLPRSWVRAQNDPQVRRRPGFPIWNLASIDERVAYSGRASVRLPTRGGSTSLLMDPGVIPVFADADYQIRAMVRTEGLEHARARLIARILDARSQPIPGLERASPLVRTDGQWRALSIDVMVLPPRAVYLQIELDLLQPDQFDPGWNLPHATRERDVSGAAWFDQLAVVLLPQTQITTGQPANMVLAPDHPQLKVFLRDLAGEAFVARLTVSDDQGRQIDRFESEPASGRTSFTWTPTLPGLGFYRARLDLVSNSGAMAVGSIDFAWLPAADRIPGPEDPGAAARPKQPVADADRFQLLIRDLRPSQNPPILEILRRSGTGGVSVPIWTPAPFPEASIQAVRHVADQLVDTWPRVTFSLDRLPQALADDLVLDPARVPSVFAAPDEPWRPYLYDLIERYGQSTQRWRLGSLGQATDLADPAARSALTAAMAALSPLVPGPMLSVPVAADPLPAPIPSELSALLVSMPAEAGPGWIADLATRWKSLNEDAGRPIGLTLVLDSQQAQRTSPARLARRLVEFWSAFPGEAGSARAHAALADPWAWTDQRRPTLVPTPQLSAWRGTIDRLLGRQPVGELPVAPGARAIIFAERPGSGAGGLIAAWNESARPDDAVIRSLLGLGPIQVVDIFGNRSPVQPSPLRTPHSAAPDALVHQIPLGSEPIFIEGADIGLVRFIASVHLEPPLLSTEQIPDRVELVLENPWDKPISGSLSIVSPGGLQPDGSRDRSWIITPRTTTFQIAPNQSTRIPMDVAFSPVQESGPRMLVMDMDIQADRSYENIRLRVPFRIGLDYLRLEASASVGPDATGSHVWVEARLTNTGDRPVSASVSVRVPGRSRGNRASIGDLSPGQSVVRRFLLPDAAADLSGGQIMVMVRDLDTGGRLNRLVAVGQGGP